MSVDALLDRLDKVRKTGKGWIACCPAHRDKHPSLSIRESDEGAVLLHLVHHAGKDISKGSRGSSALLGAVDASILVEADSTGNHVATVEWSRDSAAGERFGFWLRVVNLGIDADGDSVTTCVVVPSTEAAARPGKAVRRDVALDALREAIGQYGETMPETSTIPKGVKAVTIERWKARWALRTGYDDSTGNSINVNFHRDKDALLKAEKVAISKPYVWISE